MKAFWDFIHEQDEDVRSYLTMNDRVSNDPENVVEVLPVYVGNSRFVIPSGSISGVCPADVAIARLPNAREHVLGMTNIGGKGYVVISLHRLFSEARTQDRGVIVYSKTYDIALLADKATAVRQLALSDPTRCDSANVLISQLPFYEYEFDKFHMIDLDHLLRLVQGHQNG
ncbi:chemotaxis protein CheW [Endozoicomonas gorgoniicola]|uniref:Chemotaxis protein CheW n=1 Tax=Endozoicomonas gorgoniicola TaxID=1234144 RepID=A0ABT3MXV1_9GAMM|nr:chemotaxis protein CheW [Endozoicomonas gorgoniicola]MCW7554209.1 chemotaxis protein CheW [Endozoicomonas gorgoniicola]